MKPPIADPFFNPRAPQDALNFRADFWRSLAGYFWFFLPFTTLVFSFSWPLVRREEIGTFFLVFMATVIFASLVATAVSLCFSIQLSAAGIEAASSWCVKRELLWSEITQVRSGWFVFRMVILSARGKRNFFRLPLYLHDINGFVRAVEELAPESNPLRLWLQKRRF